MVALWFKLQLKWWRVLEEAALAYNSEAGQLLESVTFISSAFGLSKAELESQPFQRAWSCYLFLREECCTNRPVPLSAGTDNGLLDCVQFCRFPFSFLFPAESGAQAINVQISNVHLLMVTTRHTF